MKKIILISAAALLFALTAINPISAWSQTETKQSMNTIYEKRIYAIKVGEMVETKRLLQHLVGQPLLKASSIRMLLVISLAIQVICTN